MDESHEIISDAVRAIAHAIMRFETATGEDATGGTVGCLTESVMGITGGLCRVADSISDLAEAVREQGNHT